ncbi:hypothetical protein CIW50_28310 [Tardiphaga sp. P9-11]|nr:hypothetical protein CIW50_28310 [Tardiphaga sp. P9-11]
MDMLSHSCITMMPSASRPKVYCEVVDASGVHMREFSQAAVAFCPASWAFNFEPWDAAVQGSVDGRRGGDRRVIRPHAFVSAFTRRLVGVLGQSVALGTQVVRLPGQHIRVNYQS